MARVRSRELVRVDLTCEGRKRLTSCSCRLVQLRCRSGPAGRAQQPMRLESDRLRNAGICDVQRTASECVFLSDLVHRSLLALQSQKWESSAGIDPFSYGYNSDTCVLKQSPQRRAQLPLDLPMAMRMPQHSSLSSLSRSRGGIT